MKTKELARRIRVESIKMSSRARQSHVASSLSCADIVAVLYNDVLNINLKNINKINRDYFILSKGHACTAIYAALAEKKVINKKDLKKYCCNGSKIFGHMSNKVEGVEFSTGSLGHGCCVAAGIAYSCKLQNLNNRIYTLVGDGECDEGTIWEMAAFASSNNLNNFYVIIDNNNMQALGKTKDIIDTKFLGQKFKNFGFKVYDVDGHNYLELKKVLMIKSSKKPICVVAHTIKGKGVSFMENNLKWHYSDPQGKDLIKALIELGEEL